MNSDTLRAWLIEQGCRIEGRESVDRGEGQAVVLARREGRTAEVPFGGSHKAIEPETVRSICKALGLDSSKLPGFTARH